MRFMYVMRIFFFFYFSGLVKILRLVVLFYSQKKKKTVFIFIYNFYFKNLIYKLIKQFENQQKSDSIF